VNVLVGEAHGIGRASKFR